jgi:hypothetical protein
MAAKTGNNTQVQTSSKASTVKLLPRWKLVLYYTAVTVLALGIVWFLQSHS